VVILPFDTDRSLQRSHLSDSLLLVILFRQKFDGKQCMTERFPEKSSRHRDSLKSEVRLPRDERHFSYESKEQCLGGYVAFSNGFGTC
jgi:UV DNA damage repair endonuclease